VVSQRGGTIGRFPLSGEEEAVIIWGCGVAIGEGDYPVS